MDSNAYLSEQMLISSCTLQKTEIQVIGFNRFFDIEFFNYKKGAGMGYNHILYDSVIEQA